MGKKNTRPEFSYNEKTELYSKKLKDPMTGKWIAVYGHTRAETRKKVQEKEYEFSQKRLLKDNPPFFEYAAKWYSLHAGDYSPKRQQDYKNVINNHICPVIGAIPMRDITYSDIREVMTVAGHLSKSGQQKIVTALKKIFEAAVKDKILSESLCADLKPGGEDAQEKEALTKAQQEAFKAALVGTRVYPFAMLCLYAGLRREEALGLKWKNVQLDSKVPVLYVRTACNWNGANTPVLTDELKSKAAYRRIPLPPQLVDCLRELKAKQNGEFVICRDNGELWSASAFRKAWQAVELRTVRTIKRKVKGEEIEQELKLGDEVPYHKGLTVSLDFHVTPHILRHTYISELILAGTPVKRVQYLAGHSSPIITLKIYTHLMENKPEDTMDYVLKAFSK